MAGRKRLRDVVAEQAAVAPGRRFFGPEAMGVVVAALRRGETITDAAREAGFTRGRVHEWRKRAAHFDEACRAALDGRRERLLPARHAATGAWQLCKPRCNAFTDVRKTLYLDHFAATGDSAAAAVAAGVSRSTVSNHRRSDPAFAEAHREALALAREDLEAEAVRSRLQALAPIHFDPERAQAVPVEDPGVAFDRTLQLLRVHNRAPGKTTGRPPTLCSFEEGFAALERELDALEARERGKGSDGEITPPPPCGRSPSPGKPGEATDDE